MAFRGARREGGARAAMAFRKFDRKESVSALSQVKSSALRGIKASLAEEYPPLEGLLEDLVPKKGDVAMAKCADKVQMLCLGGEPLFFQLRDGPFFPTLRRLQLQLLQQPQLEILILHPIMARQLLAEMRLRP